MMEENSTTDTTTNSPIVATNTNTQIAFDVTPTTKDIPTPVADDDANTSIGPTPAKKTKTRDSPYGSILLSADRRSRKRKSLSWQPDEKIRKIHYFELFADERSNVYKAGLNSSESDANASAAGGSSPNADIAGTGRPSNDIAKRSNDKCDTEKCVTHAEWKTYLIDYIPELPTPGWQSTERSAQAEREQYVLGAIDLPGQPSTLDEPDGMNASTNCESSTKDGNPTEIIIPLDNAEGAYTEFPDMYQLETVNGIRLPSSNSTDCNVQAPIVPNMTQFQQQAAPQMLPYQYPQVAPQMYHYQQQLVNATQSPFPIFKTWFPH